MSAHGVAGGIFFPFWAVFEEGSTFSPGDAVATELNLSGAGIVASHGRDNAA